jgi:hypothetical protein
MDQRELDMLAKQGPVNRQKKPYDPVSFRGVRRDWLMGI